MHRNRGQRGWRPKQAQAMRDMRRAACINVKRFGAPDWEKVDLLLRQDSSPEQTAARLALEGELKISPESIYWYIYGDKRAGGDLWRHLRCQKPRRKLYGSGQQRRGVIKNRVSIDERPAIVEERSRIGDWERDTIIGNGHQGVIVTLAERASEL